MKAHYEILPARKYYGSHATGAVLLRNGCVEFHGTSKDTKELFKKHSSPQKRINIMKKELYLIAIQHDNGNLPEIFLVKSEKDLLDTEPEVIINFIYPDEEYSYDRYYVVVKKANILTFKEPEYLWIRMGDNAEYEKEGSVEDWATNLRDQMEDKLPIKFKRCNLYGITAEYYEGFNYISMFYGDYNAQPIRPITDKELKEINKRLTQSGICSSE